MYNIIISSDTKPGAPEVCMLICSLLEKSDGFPADRGTGKGRRVGGEDPVPRQISA